MINVLGISHKTAPLDVRGIFSISNEEILPLSEKILNETEISELVILSTCNRTEIYYCNTKAYHNKETNRVLLGILHHYKKAKQRYTDYFYAYNREDAIEHLFKVTSGMDSMVIGEDQIVKQVKEAYVFCTEQSLTDAILMRLFQKSFEVAKKVRTNTNIQQGPTSVSFVAVDQAARLSNNFENKKILILGLGETGKLVLSNLRKRGADNVTLCNRTLEKAEALATEAGEMVIPFDEYKSQLKRFDIIFSATSSEHYLIQKEDLEQGNKLFVDLSVPRNINPNVKEIDGTDLYGVDDLNSILNESANQRLESITAAEIIIDEMVSEYIEWLDIRALRPVIQSITKGIKKISTIELENSKGCYTIEDFQKIEEYSDRLAQKYIRAFIKKLKHLSNNGSSVHMLKNFSELFDFEEDMKSKIKELEEIINR